MTTWKSRGLRGSAFEELINRTNDDYSSKNLALVQKIPTPITPINIDKENQQITLAYFEQKSTVDYIGAVQGIPVCFDAKESRTDTFSIHNIHEHQVNFMNSFERQKGIAFLLIYFTQRELFYYMRFKEMKHFWDRAMNGGRKSFRLDELNEDYFFNSDGYFIPYLNLLQKDLDERND